MRSPALLVPAVLVLALAGCAGEAKPAPTPTATGFASEEEAFAAAEETYREYVEAENAIDLADPDTFEAVYALTTGDARAQLTEDLTTWHAEGYTRVGESSLDDFARYSADLQEGAVQLDVCLNVSDIDVFDANGKSLVSPDRVDVQRLRVSFDRAGNGETLISKSEGREDGLDCE